MLFSHGLATQKEHLRKGRKYYNDFCDNCHIICQKILNKSESFVPFKAVSCGVDRAYLEFKFCKACTNPNFLIQFEDPYTQKVFLNYIFPLKVLKTARVGDLRRTDRIQRGLEKHFSRLAKNYELKLGGQDTRRAKKEFQCYISVREANL